MSQIEFVYLNHRGEKGLRRIIPEALEFHASRGHGYQPGWFISGHCLDRDARRSFALSRIDFSGKIEGNGIFRLGGF